MGQVCLMRTLSMPRAVAASAIAWLKETEEIRRRRGMIAQIVLRQVTDPTSYTVIQIWADAASYAAWKESEERRALTAQGSRLYATEPTVYYDVL